MNRDRRGTAISSSQNKDNFLAEDPIEELIEEDGAQSPDLEATRSRKENATISNAAIKG